MKIYRRFLARASLALGLCLILALPSALAARPVPPPLEIGLPAEAQPTDQEMTRQQAEELTLASLTGALVLDEAALNDYRIESVLYDYPDAPGHPFWRVQLYPKANPPGGVPDYFMEIDARTGAEYLSGSAPEDEDGRTPAILEWSRRLRGAEWVWGPNHLWSLEQWASFDAWALEIGYFESSAGVAVLPGPEDFPMEDAHRIARQAVIDKYGWDEARFERYDVATFLWQETELAGLAHYDIAASLWQEGGLTGRWSVNYHPKPGSGFEEEGVFYVWIASPSGVLLEVAAEKDGNG